MELEREAMQAHKLLAKIYVYAKETRGDLTLKKLINIFHSVYGKDPNRKILSEYIKKEERKK